MLVSPFTKIKIMKICPQCNKTYNDDNLNFCLDDGSVLNQAGAGSGQNVQDETIAMNRGNTSSPQNDPPETVMMNPTPHTSQNAGFNQGFGGVQQNQPSWGAPAQPVQPVKKSSKTWLWVVGILGVLAVVCGGGLIGFIALIPSNDNTNWNSNFGNNNNSVVTNSRSKNDSSPTPDDRKDTTKVDMEKWVKGDNDLGKTEFNSGEFYMNAKKENYYYVIAAPKQYKSEKATTRITVRNVESADTELGFGLIIHSDPQPLQKDYAFLIDTRKNSVSELSDIRRQPRLKFLIGQMPM